MRILIAVLLASAFCMHVGLDHARSALCVLGGAVFGAMWQARAKGGG
jgi:hypothetical protein